MGSTQWWALACRSVAAFLSSFMGIFEAITVEMIDEINRKVTRIAGTGMIRHAATAGMLERNVLGTRRTFCKRSCNHIADTTMIFFCGIYLRGCDITVIHRYPHRRQYTNDGDYD